MLKRPIRSKKSIKSTRNYTPDNVAVLQQEVDRLNKELGQQKQKTVAAEGLVHRMQHKLKPLHEMHKVLHESLQPIKQAAEVRANTQHIMDLLHEVEGEVATARGVGC
jgi:predicted  nucleic acid-binding Zn-ribbon protein